jgi:hypothetical protein
MNTESSAMIKNWIKLGIVCGLRPQTETFCPLKKGRIHLVLPGTQFTP